MKSALILVALLPAAAFAQAATPANPVPPDARASNEPTFVVSKWKAKLYGFAELDTLLDNTQSFSEIQGNGQIARPGTSTGDNGRFQESIRNSRIGFSLETPNWDGVKGSGLIEGDFFGFNPNPAYPNPATQPSESSFYTSPTFRIRHAWAKIETPVVDVLGGQTWSVLGGSGIFQPATVALQGIVGEIYQRTEQFRLSKVLPFGDNKIELAVAALRPYQRDVQIPDLSAMVRFELGGWKGWKSTGGTGGGLTSMQLAVSGVLKQFKAYGPKPASDTDWTTASGSAIAADIILPIIPATKESHAGALTIVAEASTGTAYNDSFTGLGAGATVGVPTGAASTYSTTLDNGAVGWNNNGATPQLQTVDYQSLLVNLQFYFANTFFLTGVYSEMLSDNATVFNSNPTATYSDNKYGSLGVMWDVTPATRIGLEGVWTRQHMGDNTSRVNRRALGSMWFYF